ncbi:unnamed protein product [Bursaphelenchus xylophilus]|uniref:(pine wood nematode) hypothetical protein n=1 Tax=Bursaphelenchus xylophilus TaxID=6326 RepID=A0A7I8X4Q9_BURXY|nr:unnamed protein product [Bursaphelenchus xylophilus]CAG9122270.1 unnamed protein product [Bursaphelenchus xylophilus]
MINFLNRRFRSGFQPLKASISEFEFTTIRDKSSRRRPKKSAIPRFYSHYDMTEAVGSTNSEEVVEVLDVESSSMDGDRQVLLAFVPSSSSSLKDDEDPMNDDFSSVAYSEFKSNDCGLDRALNECNQIRLKDGFKEGLLLKCIEPKALFSFLHFATFETGSFGFNGAGQLADSLDLSSGALIGVYDELFAIQKSTSFIEPALPTHRHSGYIVSSFKILDRSSRQKQLEKAWLSWTGAREIYKYSPRTWNLRRITLTRIAGLSKDNQRTFAYVVLCEFGNILHPSNTIKALDMCERLRARNCGHVGLYQVQYNYGKAPSSPFAPPRPRLQTQSNTPSPSNSTNFRGLSPRGSPRLSPRSMPSNLMNGRRPMVRGYSQDVDTSGPNDTARRRSILLRMRDRSLGYELNEPGRFHSYQQFEELA